ncbi:FAD/NAD(P)-binding domain-containing protein [Lophiostoma macrostomum CBS 122681]|uniref:FAD/NAD(P)-binding domain-containing protein n=1 Tax=Lophiostoma macrostomum CBS 122681 TaxID=1314788 RepID=A0A6A6TA04_9PLEO|nr:FAD/NAD(P)-binding domain-containing protein [Lophiostoma macrostomum CBS 122681]
MATKPGQFLVAKRIVVVGGGLAGLAFVAALHQLWTPSSPQLEITIVERDYPESDTQEDLHLSLHGGSQDEGLLAIQKLGLLDKIREHSALNSGAIRVWSDNWKQLASIDPKPYGTLPAAAMRIKHHDLKRILLGRVKDSNATWRWASTCTAAERLSSGAIRVTISDTTTQTTSTQDCDLLIAADGANSKIRASFIPHGTELEYAGANQIGGISRLPGGLPHPVHEDYGLQMSSGEGVCCIYTPFDNETIGWALSVKGPERGTKLKKFTPAEFADLKSEALRTGSMFGEPFKTIVEATDPTTAFIRPAKERRPSPHDPKLLDVVFIGDAGHVTNCFEYVGADCALKDAWDLAEQLCRNISMEAAIAAYDKVSIPRVNHAIDWSHERIRFGHSTGLMWKVYKHGMAVQRAMARKKE